MENETYQLPSYTPYPPEAPYQEAAPPPVQQHVPLHEWAAIAEKRLQQLEADMRKMSAFVGTVRGELGI